MGSSQSWPWSRICLVSLCARETVWVQIWPRKATVSTNPVDKGTCFCFYTSNCISCLHISFQSHVHIENISKPKLISYSNLFKVTFRTITMNGCWTLVPDGRMHQWLGPSLRKFGTLRPVFSLLLTWPTYLYFQALQYDNRKWPNNLNFMVSLKSQTNINILIRSKCIFTF